MLSEEPEVVGKNVEAQRREMWGGGQGGAVLVLEEMMKEEIMERGRRK